jgi:hypothetical protein
MTTKLDQPLKRGLSVDGRPYTLTITPDASISFPKADAKARSCAGSISSAETLPW